MADSNITCSGLTATSGVGQLALRWLVTNPNAGGLPYLDLGAVEVWAASANDRAGAAKVGEGLDAFLHAGKTAGATRFYWVRPRNASALYGDWYPLSATAGVAGTAGTAQPGPGTITAVELAPAAVTAPALAPAAVTATAIASAAIERAKIAFAAVGSAQIEDASITNAKIANAAIDNAKISNLSADKITFGTLSGITITSVTINGGTITGGSISGVTISGAIFSGGQIIGAIIYGTTVEASRFTSGLQPRMDYQSSVGEMRFYDNFGSYNGRVGTGSRSQPVIAISDNFPGVFIASFSNGSAAAVQGISPTYAFYATSGAYGPFTGAHELLWPIDEPLPDVGDLVADDGVVFRNGVSNTLCLGSLAREGTPALGVFVRALDWARTAAMGDEISDEQIDALCLTYRLILVNALGEGQINLAPAAVVGAGDLLVASEVPGKATRQHDDILRASTVARARESSNSRSQIACIYLAG